MLESAGVEEAASAVVSVVDESLGDAAEVFEASVDGFGGAVAGVGVVEVGQDVPGSAFEGSAHAG